MSCPIKAGNDGPALILTLRCPRAAQASKDAGSDFRATSFEARRLRRLAPQDEDFLLARHARLYAGHPRLCLTAAREDVDGRNKSGHDEDPPSP